MSGESSRKAGNDFEKRIEPTFDAYKEAGVAELDFYPVPMRPTGKREAVTGTPYYLPKGTAPFDVWGYSAREGKVIAAELKHSHRSNSIAIIMPSKSGAGVRWHQLCALRNIAMAGGIARLVWSNEGEVGVLREKGIIAAFDGAWHALHAEDRPVRGKPVSTRGLKSIRWEKFENVDYEQINGAGIPVLAWLKHEVFYQAQFQATPVKP